MKTNKHLIISGIMFTIIIFLWPVLMILSQPPKAESAQMEWVLSNLTIYRLQFFVAFLIGPSIIYLMIAQINKYPDVENLRMISGLIFLTGYLVLISISYASQMTIFPGLLLSGSMEQAKLWYFGSFNSVSYFLNQLGYLFWAVGALILFADTIRKKGMIKYISIIYVISAFLCFVAFAGLISGSETLNSATVFGGLVLVPIGMMTFFWGLRENKKIKHHG